MRERYLILSLSFTSGNIAHFVSFRFIALFVLLLFCCCCLKNNFLNNTFRLHYFKLSYSFFVLFVEVVVVGVCCLFFSHCCVPFLSVEMISCFRSVSRVVCVSAASLFVTRK